MSAQQYYYSLETKEKEVFQKCTSSYGRRLGTN